MPLAISRRFALVTVVAIALNVPAAAAPQSAPDSADEGWICPPCGHADDDHVYSEPGTCPKCGMKLVTTREQAAALASQIRAAILVFDGVQIIDFTAPYEVFGQAHFRTFTVSPDGGPVTTAMGLKVTPDYGFADAPEVDVLLVPGGDVHAIRASEEALSWVRRTADEADYVLSVCNGAFILAEAGLLEGKQATTFYGMLDELQESFPGVEVVRDRRYADNGKVLTSAGLSSGIDASLHLASRILGEDRARTLALHLEYDWDPEATFARGALADRHLPAIDLDLPPGVSLQRLTSLGDRDSWEIRWSVDPDVDASVLVDAFARALDGRDGWQAGARTGETMTWHFSTRDDGDWVASLRVARSGDDALVTANLARADE